MSLFEEMARRTAVAAWVAGRTGRDYDIAAESLELYVPKPRGKRPYGLFVWISPDEPNLPKAWQTRLRPQCT